MPETLVADPATEVAAAATLAAEQAAAAALAANAPSAADKAAADAVAEAAKIVPVVPAVPEKYDLKLPEGSKVDAAIVERTAAKARELGLSNEAGQKLLDSTVQEETARAEAYGALVDSWKPGGTAFVERDKAWRAEALADPDIGGTPEKLAISIEKGQQALTRFGPELKTLLHETGEGSHPAVIKFLAAIGNAMSEATPVFGNSGTPMRKKTDAEILYPNHYNDDGTAKTP